MSEATSAQIVGGGGGTGDWPRPPARPELCWEKESTTEVHGDKSLGVGQSRAVVKSNRDPPGVPFAPTILKL